MSTQPETTLSNAAIPAATARSSGTGVIILGGAHSALAIARGLGRQGIPIVIVTDDHPLPKFSRYVRQRFDWPGPASPDAARWLIALAEREHFEGWLLVPCADGDVRMVASNIETLAQTFCLASCGWEDLKKVCDKQLLPQLAAACGVDFPKAYIIANQAEAEALDAQYPVVLKPATRDETNAFTLAKAWRADSRDELMALYRQAAVLVGGANVVVQEFVPGGGETQFSYMAVWHEGRPIAEMTTRRTRQFPLEFSTSTFVETMERAPIVEPSRRILSAIRFRGLVEIEYKFDTRDGRHKVLDVNPRAWSWLGLTETANINMALVLYQSATGQGIWTSPPAPRRCAWLHSVRDLLAAFELIRRGDLNVSGYVKSLWRQKLTFATFALDDPLPGLCEIPLTFYRVLTRRLPLLFRRGAN